MPAARKTTAPKSAAKPAAKKSAPKTTPAKPSLTTPKDAPTAAERKALAQKIIKLREAGTKWDGDGGICDQVGISGALVGRKLMREFGAGEQIKPLTGMRAKS
jgi:hypothetical protein